MAAGPRPPYPTPAQKLRRPAHTHIPAMFLRCYTSPMRHYSGRAGAGPASSGTPASDLVVRLACRRSWHANSTGGSGSAQPLSRRVWMDERAHRALAACRAIALRCSASASPFGPARLCGRLPNRQRTGAGVDDVSADRLSMSVSIGRMTRRQTGRHTVERLAVFNDHELYCKCAQHQIESRPFRGGEWDFETKLWKYNPNRRRTRHRSFRE